MTEYHIILICLNLIVLIINLLNNVMIYQYQKSYDAAIKLEYKRKQNDKDINR